MKKTCLLFMMLLLPLFALSACATIPRQCNYARPHANYSEDRYRCQMLAETKLQNTGDPRRMGGMVPLWQTDCMSQLGWQNCR
jgi:starvation-inducible outer membrane lipoprotein